MLSKDRPSTAGLTTSAGGGLRTFETFSKQHREKLAMGAGLGAGTTTVKSKRYKARITVVVRKRPLAGTELGTNVTDILKISGSSKTGMKVEEPRKNVCGVPYTELHDFTFDRVYANQHTNRHVYRSCVRQLVDAVFTQGARCSCFAYGQTGSGKTYTMCGAERMGNQTNPEHQGLLELAGRDCFKWLQQPEFDYHFGLYVSFFEIYCNKVYDLLGERRLVKALETKTADGVVVKDLTTVKVDSVETLLQYINSGLDLRVVGSNSKNSDSSRGHGLLTLEVKNEHTQTNFGKLAFIDLAGSERGADAMNSGKQTQTDGAGINRSLLALKECIRALDQQSSHVPFRDSELTKVLRDMFIGNKARTLMISCVSPSSGCCEQTLNTLRYADRVKAIRRNCQPDVGTDKECDDDRSAGGEPSKVDSDEATETKGSRRRKRSLRDNKSEGTIQKSETVDHGDSRRNREGRRVHDRRSTLNEPPDKSKQSGQPRKEKEQTKRSPSPLSAADSMMTDTEDDDERYGNDGDTDSDESDRKSAMLSLGTSHDSDDYFNEGKDRDTTASDSDLGEQEGHHRHHAAAPSARHNEGQVTTKTVRTTRSTRSTSRQPPGHDSHEADSPRALVDQSAVQRHNLSDQSRPHSAASQHLSRPTSSRGIESRRGASSIDPAMEDHSSPMHDGGSLSLFARQTGKQPRPSTATLTVNDQRGVFPRSMNDPSASAERPVSQQLNIGFRRLSIVSGSNASLARQGQNQLLSVSKKGNKELSTSRQARSSSEDSVGATEEASLLSVKGTDTHWRKTAPPASHPNRDDTLFDVRTVLPKPESDDLVAAAHLLRKRYREFEFPIPPNAAPADGKPLGLTTAVDMVNRLLTLPANDINRFLEPCTGKIQQFYSDLAQAHADCLKAITCSGMTQHKMLKEVLMSQRPEKKHQTVSDINRQYLTNLRSALENQLMIQIRLAKRLCDMERMLSLQRTMTRGIQAASASGVEYNLHPTGYPDVSASRTGMTSKDVFPSSRRPSVSYPSSPASKHLSPPEQYSSRRGISSRFQEREDSSSSSRSEDEPLVREVTKTRGAGTSSMVTNYDSRPLQPPTALSLDVATRPNTVTGVRRREETQLTGADGFPIPNDLSHHCMTRTSSIKRNRRHKQEGLECTIATGDLAAAVKDGSSVSTKLNGRAAR